MRTPGKTFVISASAMMPNDLPLWAERKIDVLSCSPTAKPPAFSKLARQYNSGVETPVFLRKPEDSTLSSPTAPQGP